MAKSSMPNFLTIALYGYVDTIFIAIIAIRVAQITNSHSYDSKFSTHAYYLAIFSIKLYYFFCLTALDILKLYDKFGTYRKLHFLLSLPDNFIVNGTVPCC